jgi:hypothetical protein
LECSLDSFKDGGTSSLLPHLGDCGQKGGGQGAFPRMLTPISMLSALRGGADREKLKPLNFLFSFKK